MSPHAKDIIQSMLKINPADRPSVEEALKHDFIQNSYLYCPHCGQYRADLAKNPRLQQLLDVDGDFLNRAIARAKHFQSSPALLRLVCILNARGFTGSDHANLSENGQFRRLFRSIDETGDGRVNPNDLRVAIATHNIAMDDTEFENLFAAMDISATGSITIFDFLAVITEPHVLHRPEVIMATWRELDRTNKGYICHSDLRAIMSNSPMTDTELQDIINEVSGSAMVTLDNFRNMMMSY